MKGTIEKKVNRVFSLLLAVVMVFSAVPMSVNATTNSEGYIEVRTIEDLYNIRNDLTANYILMNDIDLTEATAEGGDWDFMGNGWNPIGSNDIYGDGEFSGEFDGNGHKIIGMRIDLQKIPSGIGQKLYAGLFSKISGIVSDLNFEECNINFLYGSENSVGTVAGVSSGTLNDILVDAKIDAGYRHVSGTNVSYEYVGGLVGQNVGRIENCANKNEIIGRGYYDDVYIYVGGISGTNDGKIIQCYNLGDITGDSRLPSGITGGFYPETRHAGGIAGKMPAGLVENSYNTGFIRATTGSYASEITMDKNGAKYVGGIVGELQAGRSGEAKIITCYNVGETPNLNSKDKGIANLYNDWSIIEDSYYLINTGSSSTGATALTEGQMKIQSMYAGFDFENVWVMNVYANHPYPQLRSNIQDMNETVELVRIVNLPTKLNYYTDAELDLSGSLMEVVYISGRTESMELTAEMISGYDPAATGTQTLTATFGGQSDTFEINVVERPEVIGIEIVSEPTQKEFFIGSAFDFSGAVLQIAYSDGNVESVAITEEMTTGGNINHLGEYTISVAVGEFTDSFKVKVVAVSLQEIAIATLPDQVVYLEGEAFDASGLTLNAIFNDGNTRKVTSGYECEGYSAEPGKYTITVTYQEKQTTFEVEVKERSVVSLELRSAPEKTEYIAGEPFDPTGIVLLATYDNGVTEVAEDYTISGFTDTAGLKVIKLEFGGKSVALTVRVLNRVMTGLEIISEPAKLTYIENEALNTEGLVVMASYNDGSTEEISDYKLTGFSSLPGLHTVYVTYNGAVDSFQVSVSAKVLSDLRITPPEKIAYEIGEELDLTGLIVMACYNNGQEIEVDDYQISGFDSSASGAKSITVSYGGFARSFAVAVAERSQIATGGHIAIGEMIGRLGEQVEVPVTVSKNTGIAGFTHTIGFDESNLKFIGAKAEGGFADGVVILNEEKAASGEVVILWVGDQDVAESGVVYTLTFEILETAADGETEITIDFEDNDNGNISGENVLFGKVNGSVEVRSYWLGDLTGDREFHMADLLMLGQYVAGKEMTLTEKQLLSADVNEDTVIDIHDVILLQQWILEAGVPEEA